MSKSDATTTPTDSEEFSTRIQDLLTTHDSENLSPYMKTHGTDEILDKTSWSLVPTICLHLTEENLKTQNDFFISCEELLQIYADKCNPAETVLLFLEQAENLPDDVRFRALLKPLRTSLKRGDISKSIEWVVSTIRAYVEDLPLPENVNPERITSKTPVDPVIERLTATHRAILDFLSSVIDIALERRESNPQEVKVLMNLINIHLNLFSKPFSHLDLKPDDTGSIFHMTISQMLRLEKDPLKFLKIIENRSHKRANTLKPEGGDNNLHNLEIQLFDLEVSDLTYAHFFFSLISSNSLFIRLPQVYNPHYIMNCCLYLANCLVKQTEYVLISKGLRFVQEVLKRVAEESIQPEALELTIHEELFSSISQVMIYCDSMEERQLALGAFQAYIRRFSMSARHRLIGRLYEMTKHSGLLALIINILKTWIIISLERGDEEFLGKLEDIFRRIFRLPHGILSDLVEISDEIIAALNLLRFLVIRDRSNVTGIWALMREIQKGYLKVLRDGVDLARAHWKIKVKDLEKQARKGKLGRERVDTEVAVVVGGEQLPDMPVGDKIKFCHQALNALDVIESIIIRVNECADANPMRNVKLNG